MKEEEEHGEHAEAGTEGVHAQDGEGQLAHAQQDLEGVDEGLDGPLPHVDLHLADQLWDVD